MLAPRRAGHEVVEIIARQQHDPIPLRDPSSPARLVRAPSVPLVLQKHDVFVAIERESRGYEIPPGGFLEIRQAVGDIEHFHTELARPPRELHGPRHGRARASFTHSAHEASVNDSSRSIRRAAYGELSSIVSSTSTITAGGNEPAPPSLFDRRRPRGVHAPPAAVARRLPRSGATEPRTRRPSASRGSRRAPRRRSPTEGRWQRPAPEAPRRAGPAARLHRRPAAEARATPDDAVGVRQKAIHETRTGREYVGAIFSQGGSTNGINAVNVQRRNTLGTRSRLKPYTMLRQRRCRDDRSGHRPVTAQSHRRLPGASPPGIDGLALRRDVLLRLSVPRLHLRRRCGEAGSEPGTAGS